MFEDDEIVMIGNKPVTFGVVYAKIKGLGWDRATAAAMDDATLANIVKNKTKAPAKQEVVKPVQEATTKKVIDLNALDDQPDTEIMGGSSASAAIGEPSLVTMANRPPLPGGNRIKPIDPTRPAPTASGITPAADSSSPAPLATPILQAVPTPPAAPSSDPSKLKSVLQAAKALARVPGQADIAKHLLKEHNLELAFLTLYQDEAKSLFAGVDLTKTPTDRCEGGVIFGVEQVPGAIYLTTNIGILAITGANLTVSKRS